MTEAHIDRATMMVERCSVCGCTDTDHLVVVRNIGVCPTSKEQ